MALPTTKTCPSCQQDIPVIRTEYIGLRQPDPTKDGLHVYVIQAECLNCKVRTVSTHLEKDKQ